MPTKIWLQAVVENDLIMSVIEVQLTSKNVLTIITQVFNELDSELKARNWFGDKKS